MLQISVPQKETTHIARATQNTRCMAQNADVACVREFYTRFHTIRQVVSAIRGDCFARGGLDRDVAREITTASEVVGGYTTIGQALTEPDNGSDHSSGECHTFPRLVITLAAFSSLTGGSDATVRFGTTHNERAG